MASEESKDLYTGEGSMKWRWDSTEFAQIYAIAERMTGRYAERLLKQANLDKVASDQDLVILDEACGTGVVSARLINMLSDESQDKLNLTMVDLSQPMIDLVVKRIDANGWKNTKAITADVADSKLPSSHFTHIVLNFGPFIFPDPTKGLGEIYRMLRPGGVAAFSSHSRVGWIPDVIAAWKTDPELPPFPTNEGLQAAFGKDLHWNDADWIKQTVSKAGFVDVEVTTSDLWHSEPNAATTFKLLLPGTIGMIVNTFWSQELRDKYAERAKEVSCRYIDEKYGDGELGWQWTALLTTARKPT